MQHFKFQEVSQEYLNRTYANTATIPPLLSLRKLHTRKDNKDI